MKVKIAAEDEDRDQFPAALASDKTLNTRFNTVTAYKQKEYAEFISSAKRPETRVRRLEKSVPLILNGKGLNDRYRY